MENRRTKILQNLTQSVLDYDCEKARKAATEAINAGLSPVEAIEEGLAKGISIIGDLFERGQIFLPELIMAGEAMKAGVDVLTKGVRRHGLRINKIGKVLIGTVHGDIHDIGKNIVVSMLEAAGFEVIDLGIDVSTETFVEKTREIKPDILGMSALTTTTALEQKKVISALKDAGLRNNVKVIIGGVAASERWAEEIGADAYAADAIEGVRKIKSLLGIKE